MPPRFFKDIILINNGNYYNNEKLCIVNIRNKGKKYSTSVINGHCPKQFISWLFGDSQDSTIVVNRDGSQSDVCNCNFQFLSEFGDFKFKARVVHRHRSDLPWIGYAGTVDSLM